MSRSYKKHTCYKHNVRWAKRAASKKVRKQNFNLPSGNAYKKVYQQYDICDYKFYVSFIAYISGEDETPIEKLYKDWCKYYKRK